MTITYVDVAWQDKHAKLLQCSYGATLLSFQKGTSRNELLESHRKTKSKVGKERVAVLFVLVFLRVLYPLTHIKMTLLIGVARIMVGLTLKY